MEIYKIVDDVMLRLQKTNFYSELSPEMLKDCIHEYLNSEYNKMISELSVYFELKKMSGDEISDYDYDREFEKIKYKLLQKVEDIYRSSK